MCGNFKLTADDLKALDAGDGEALNDHGADCYRAGDYARAVEYYRLAAGLGEVTAIVNLGYCYLYGRAIWIWPASSCCWPMLATESSSMMS
ncbi:tetratricopeptide repeat protein [Lactobacillus equicursoris]|uniref:Tetratricopeptide repeat protein n=1 Tax=Lactobacillus equicursoris TaxID=420645 RepID=A0A844FKI7_9LACO|nr:tetratricopeptide repeat protein [Lactobacillus equicursoris]MST78926.1 tetratricopeptide repeat protein [Lactobacillus equicursoris]